MAVKKQIKKNSLNFLKRIKPLFKRSDKIPNDELVIKHMKCIKDYREIKDYYFGSDSDDSDTGAKTIFSVKKKSPKKKTITKKKI